eukprot:6311760-Ditylum_brightwellii.AAC.1
MPAAWLAIASKIGMTAHAAFQDQNDGADTLKGSAEHPMHCYIALVERLHAKAALLQVMQPV